MIEFESWPKTPRLSNGGVTITEKIDGTNACIAVFPITDPQQWGKHPGNLGGFAWVKDPAREDLLYLVGAQSRKKLIFPGKDTDNAGFAGWVLDHAVEIVDLLGPGRHFGEWWGQGIQRRYGLDHKVFSLFNYHKFSKIAQERHDWRNRAHAIHMTMVPLLHAGRFSDLMIQDCLSMLRRHGSPASAEWGVAFSRPEGVIIRHRDLGGNLKAFVEDDDTPKSLQLDTTRNQVSGRVDGKLIQAGNVVGPVFL